MWPFNSTKTKLPDSASALAGRPDPIPTAERHFVNGTPLSGPYPEGAEIADFALGCFWGAEKTFWQTPGVIVVGRRLRGRPHAEPDLRGGLLRQDGPR